MNDELFICVQLPNFVSHFADDLFNLIGATPKRVEFGTQTLGGRRAMKEYLLTFIVDGTMYFGIVERMLPFLLTFQVLSCLLVSCLKLEACGGNVFVVVSPTSFLWWWELEVDRQCYLLAKD